MLRQGVAHLEMRLRPQPPAPLDPPDHLVGRGLTLQNLSVFIGVSVIQSASGFIVGAYDMVDAASAEAAYRGVFAFLGGATLVATLLYLPIKDVKPRG